MIDTQEIDMSKRKVTWQTIGKQMSDAMVFKNKNQSTAALEAAKEPVQQEYISAGQFGFSQFETRNKKVIA